MEEVDKLWYMEAESNKNTRWYLDNHNKWHYVETTVPSCFFVENCVGTEAGLGLGDWVLILMGASGDERIESLSDPSSDSSAAWSIKHNSQFEHDNFQSVIAPYYIICHS